MTPNPFESPRAEEAPRRLALYRLWAVAPIGGVLLALDGASWYSGSRELGVYPVMMRTCLLVAGLASCMLGLAFFATHGPRSARALRLLLLGLEFALLSVVSWALSLLAAI
jgi:hypothetical protein